MSLSFDVQPHGLGDSEYAAGQRWLHRAVGNLGPRFADCVVADGEFATAPFLHAAGDVGLKVVARLKENLPELPAAAQKRFRSLKPKLRFGDGEVIEAYCLTNFSSRLVSSRTLYRMAKSRWEIENQGFNDGKNRHGMEHIGHHEPNRRLLQWLITALALTIERLYRLQCLHRGKHPVHTAAELVLLLRLSLGHPRLPTAVNRAVAVRCFSSHPRGQPFLARKSVA